MLEPGENVWLVTPATTWASPQALLAASDRRLLWLLDDAVTGRVQTLPFAAIEAAEHTLRRPRRRVATLRVRARDGRRFAFGELRPATAAALARGSRGRLSAPRPLRSRAPDQRDRHDREQRQPGHRPPAGVVGARSRRRAEDRDQDRDAEHRAELARRRAHPAADAELRRPEVAHADGDGRREAEPDADAHQQHRRQPLGDERRLAPTRVASHTPASR